MTLWYLSFASEKEFLGATVVEARSPAHSIAVTADKGLNPGGEVMIVRIPPDLEDVCRDLLNRLVSKKELMDADGVRWGDLSPDEKAAVPVSKVCEDCNDQR